MADEVFDPILAAAVAQNAEQAVLDALRATQAERKAAAESAAAVAADKAAITALFAAVGVNHQWDDTKVRLKLPDGTWGAWVDLKGIQGDVGPTPAIVVGTVASGSSPAAQITPDPNDPLRWVLDLVLAQGAAGAAGPAGTGDVNGPASSVADELAAFSGTGGKTLKSIGVVLSGYLKTILNSGVGTHQALRDLIGVSGLLDLKQDVSSRGVANGYADLDGTGKLPLARIPSSLLGAVKYQATWDASANSPTIPAASSANQGWYYKVGTAGATAVDGITDWKVGDWIISNGTAWEKVDNTDQVVSVATLQGAITAAALKTALAIVSTDLGDFTEAVQDVVGGFVADSADIDVTYNDVGNVESMVLTPTAKPYGTVEVPLNALTFDAKVTNGPTSYSAETTTNKNVIKGLAFNKDTQQGAQFWWTPPKSWDGGTIAVKAFKWTAPVGSGNVIWGLRARAFTDGDSLDQALGTGQTVTDAMIAANQELVSGSTSAITIAGSPAAGKRVLFEVYRDAANVSDTFNSDAILTEVVLQITTIAGNDT